MQHIPTDSTPSDALASVKMQIVVVVLCGPGRERQVVQALLSAIWGTHYVLVHPQQEGADLTVAAARAFLGRKPSTVVSVEWDGFSSARQAGHDAAALLRPEWIVTLDTDQVLDFKDARAVMWAALQQGYTVLRANDGNANRERAIAGGCQCKWIGRIHEYPAISPYVAFDPPEWSLFEHGKDAQASLEQQHRYLELLTRELQEPDPLGRTHFYLARTQQFLGLESLAATQVAYDTSPAPEQAALAAYDYALVKDDPAWCGLALAKFPLAEAAWLLSSIYYRRGDREQAQTWSVCALSMINHPRTVFNVRGDIQSKCFAIYKECTPEVTQP